MSDLSINCTKCGRPMAICNGDCDCHPKPARACPCEDAVNACLARGKMPNCENKAYIPWITLPNLGAAKNVFNSLVQISENNTLYYIGCDQRVTKLVANPVEIDNYDLENNPNNLRSQFVIDFANNRGAYYNETGEYQIFYFGEHGGGDTKNKIVLSVNDDELAAWQSFDMEILDGEIVDRGPSSNPRYQLYGTAVIGTGSSTVTFTNEKTGDTVTLAEAYALMDDENNEVYIWGIPFGKLGTWVGNPQFGDIYPLSAYERTTIDPIEQSAFVSHSQDDPNPITGYAGTTLFPYLHYTHTYEVIKNPVSEEYMFQFTWIEEVSGAM